MSNEMQHVRRDDDTPSRLDEPAARLPDDRSKHTHNQETDYGMSQRYEEISLAVTLLTRFPWPAFDVTSKATLTSSVWAFPIVGAVVGALGGCTVAAALAIGLNPAVSAALALAVMVLSTGGFHEDGLADFCDGVAGGRTRDDKLAIMRDSRIGTYGVLSLVLSLMLSAAALVQIIQNTEIWKVVATFAAASALSRAVVLIPLLLTRPVRENGLAATMTSPTVTVCMTTIAIATGLAAIAWPVLTLVSCCAAALIAAVTTTMISSRYLGGYTGDVLGATISLSFVAVVIAASVGVSTQ